MLCTQCEKHGYDKRVKAYYIYFFKSIKYFELKSVFKISISRLFCNFEI